MYSFIQGGHTINSKSNGSNHTAEILSRSDFKGFFDSVQIYLYFFKGQVKSPKSNSYYNNTPYPNVFFLMYLPASI